MGDYNDFFGVRGPNKRTWVRVEYLSGRKEAHDYGTVKKAQDSCTLFMALGTVKAAEIVPKRKLQKEGLIS